MEEVEKLLHWLSNVLDNRVFVALTRGLWDLTSKDVLDYTEDLREGGGQKVCGCVCVRLGPLPPACPIACAKGPAMKVGRSGWVCRA